MIYFVIDTEELAGNGERDLCAFMTGQIGDCEVGAKVAADFEDEFEETDWFERMEDLVGTEQDDNGCWRPCKIWPTPGWFNNGLGGHFRVNNPGAEEAARVHYAQQAAEWRERHHDSGAALEWDGHHHYAYLSVAIVLNGRPTEKDVAFLKERAKAWSGDRSLSLGPPTITGFRLVTTRKVSEEEPL